MPNGSLPSCGRPNERFSVGQFSSPRSSQRPSKQEAKHRQLQRHFRGRPRRSILFSNFRVSRKGSPSAAHQPEAVTKEMRKELTHRILHDSSEAREAINQLTGEWIVYLRHEAENYYLCCSAHEDGDQFINDRIIMYCLQDFPNIPTWLKDQQNL